MLLDHPSDGPAAIRTQFGAIFVSLELPFELADDIAFPGKGEKMCRHSVTAGNIAGLTELFADLKRKAEVRTGRENRCDEKRMVVHRLLAETVRAGARCAERPLTPVFG
jgi:hypothetical protein